MENASDALIMAASVLIFIIALTITISSFSKVRAGIDRIISQTETVELAQDTKGYVNYMKANTDTTRIVGAETVISSMYRTLKENYVVYIKNLDMSDSDLYKDIASDVKDIVKIEELKGTNGKKILKFTLNENDEMLKRTGKLAKSDQNLQKNYNQLMKNFYNIIKDLKFTESLGEYQNKTNSGVAEENKMTYRIITYEKYEKKE